MSQHIQTTIPFLADDEPAAMVHITGTMFWMGSNEHYPEERPARRVSVDDFWIDVAPVTNRQYLAFVNETGHVTEAERAPDPSAYPDADPALLQPGSAVFFKPASTVQPNDLFQWWSFCLGANWRRPYGPTSDIDSLMDHPVVHISYADALAYADWADKSLPTEAEWELAARGGLDRKPYAWGDTLAPDNTMLANYWQGQFPTQNTLLDGYERTSPIGSFPPNGYGLYDMIGNVWEWTSDWYSDRSDARSTASCCIPHNPRGGPESSSHDLSDPGAAFPRKVLKGGSHLCAENYCLRYRPAARYPQTIDTSTSHIGFRCVRRKAAA